jgi:thioredoxin reductase (NADPH)
VAVIGGGNSAAEESLFLTRFADRVTLLVRREALRATKIIQDSVLSNPQIEVHFNTVVEGFAGADSKLSTIRVRNLESGETSDLDLPGAFVFIGLDPNTGFLEDTPVRRDSQGFIITGHTLVHGREPLPGFNRAEPRILETSVSGIFAAGDVRAASTKQVASAAGEGAAAAIMIRDYLRTV